MKYVAWISLTFSLLMAVLDPRPVWWILSACGIVANVLVCGLNGWKMPVRGLTEERVRHTAMTPATRLKWLGDVIPTGLGLASIGDFLLVAGFMGVWANKNSLSYVAMIVGAGYWVWSSGYSGGFRLLSKWDKEERKDAWKNIPILLLLILAGNLLGVRGCGGTEMKASVEKLVPETATISPVKLSSTKQQSRSLGDVSIAPPSTTTLRRLKQEQYAREKERLRQEEEEAKNKAVDAMMFFPSNFSIQKTGTRKGPQCRITCSSSGCHGKWDVETLPEFCKANWIPPNADTIPGWVDSGNGYEVTVGRPGPAQEGFEKYKLYWKN